MLAEEVSRLSAQLRRTEKRLEMTKGRIAELENDMAALRELRERAHELKVENLTEHAKGEGAAYEDCARRAHVVEKEYYEDDPDTSDAFRELARGFKHLMRESEAEVERLHARAFELDRERHI